MGLAADRLGRVARTDTLTWRLALANLAAQILIVVTGGLVRLTGSGLGCSTWPLCEPGSFTPVFHEATSYHAFVEFGNRTLTGVLAAVALALLVALIRTRAPRPQRALGWAVIALIGVQAVVGGLSVHLELHPAVVGLHMYVSFVLIAVSAYLVSLIRFAGVPTRAPSYAPLAWVLAGAGAVLMFLGVLTTGTGPHSGDDDAPYRFALDPLAITRAHSGSAWLFLGLLAATVWASWKVGDGLRRWTALAVLVVVQGALGYAQYFTGLPIWLVLAHMFLAACLVAALTLTLAGLWQSAATGRPAA